MRVQSAKILWYSTKSKQNVAKCNSQFSTWPNSSFQVRISCTTFKPWKPWHANPRLRHLCSTLCCATYSPILFGKIESGVYIVQKSNLFLQPGGVVAICHPNGGQEGVIMGLSVGPPWACRRRVPSKPGVSSGNRSEDWVSWELQRKAAREAGNRAAITFRSGQWRDSVPERFVVNNSTG